MPRIRPEGGLTGKIASPSVGVATGMWTMRDVDRNIRNSTWPVDVGQTDPYFNLNTLLIHADGSNNANNNVILDETEDKVPFAGTYSVYFNGSPDYLQVTAPSLNYTTQPFTIECWVYPNAQLSGTGILSSNFSSGTIPIALGTGSSAGNATGSTLFLGYYNGTSWVANVSSSSLTVGSWSHLAISYDGTAAKLYLNGNTIATLTTAWTTTLNTTLNIGRRWDTAVGSSPYFNGYISNVRYVKGTSLYSGNFTPPTTQLTNTPVQEMPYMSSNTYYGIFNGTNQWVTTSSSTFAIGTSDYTLECWFNVQDITKLSSSNVPIFKNYTSGTNNLEIRLQSGMPYLYYNGTILSSNTSVSVDTWYHVAAVKSGSNVAIYINGNNVASATGVSGSVTGTGPRIGTDQLGSNFFGGWISNLRLANTAVYSENFTPSGPLTSISKTLLLTLQSSTITDNGPNALTITNNNSVTTFYPSSKTSLLTCQSSTIIDNSPNGYTITTAGGAPTVSSGNYPIALARTGNPGQGTFSPFSVQNGYWSNYFSSTSSYLTFSDISAGVFGTGDFTVECWFWPTTSAQNLIHLSPTTNSFALITFNTMLYWQFNGATLINTSTTVPLNAWNHVAVVRSSSITKIYLNGVEVGSGTDNSNYTGTPTRVIGSNGGTSGPLYLSNVRIVKGSAVYTSNFTPPLSPLTNIAGTTLLTAQSNRFIDNSTSPNTLTLVGTPSAIPFSPFAPTVVYSSSSQGGSYAFNGSSDYFRVAANSASFGFGTSDFTVEWWSYFNSIPNSTGGIDFRINNGTASQTKVHFQIASSAMGFYTSSTARITHPITVNQWLHFALVRSNGVSKFYLNGIANGTSYSDTTDYGTASPLSTTWGDNPGAVNGFLNGYISDIRVAKSAVYTTNFTPPTSPLTTSAANTTFLLNGTNAGIIDQTGKNSMATVGGARLSTTQKKFGSSSIFFNGTTDYIELNDFASSAISASTLINSGDFTVEGWFNSNGSANPQTLFYLNGLSTGYAAARIDWTTGNALQVLVSTSGSAWAINYTPAGSALNVGQWYHIALVRSGNSFSLYVDGTLRGAAQSLSGVLTAGTGFQLIGAVINSTYQYFYNGYMDEFRVTREARYTSDFTPPQQSFLDR